MAGFMIIADRDEAYAQALADRIRHHFPACTVATATDDETVLDFMSRQTLPPILIITEAQFRMDRLTDGARLIIPLQTSRSTHPSGNPDQPVRLGSIQPILKRIGQAGFSQCPSMSETYAKSSADKGSDQPIATTPHPVDSDNHAATSKISDDTPLSIPINQTEQELPSVILLMTQTTNGRDARYADERCRALLEGGTLIHYLPLMPNYYCTQWRLPNTGSTFGLTDLLLRIGSGGLPISELGAFESMDMLGRLQFRPTDRADDMAHARPDDLYRLCALLRERTVLESRSIFVIETAGLAFRQVRPILALCDQVEVIFPSGDRYVDEMLRREIGDVLSDLPSPCRVVRIPDRKNDGKAGSLHSSEVIG